jgi:hypothetical protein
MKETGFPSPFIDIMMFSPALRTVQPGLAHLPDVALEGRVGGFHHRIRVAQVTHQLDQSGEAAFLRLKIIAGEFDQQQRVRLAAHEAVDGGAEHRDFSGQVDHGAVHKFDRRRVQLDNMPGRFHGRAEGREMADAQDLVFRDRLQIQLDLVKEGQRTFRSHKQAGHVMAGRVDRFDIVATDLA